MNHPRPLMSMDLSGMNHPPMDHFGGEGGFHSNNAGPGGYGGMNNNQQMQGMDWSNNQDHYSLNNSDTATSIMLGNTEGTANEKKTHH